MFVQMAKFICLNYKCNLFMFSFVLSSLLRCIPVQSPLTCLPKIHKSHKCICPNSRMYLSKLQKQSLRAFIFFCFDPLISISPFCRSSTKATSLPRVFVAVHCNTTSGETQYQCQYQSNITKYVLAQYQIYTW